MITSADGKRIEGLIYFAETHKQTKFGLLNQTVLVVRSCLFASQYLFLCAGDFSLPVCLVLSLSGHRSGLFFYLGRLMLLTVLSILAVQPKPHWPDTQMLSPLIVGTRCHSDPLLFCWPTRCTFFPGVFAVAIWFAAHPDLLTDTLRPCDKVLSRNPPHQGSFM